jgi:hypothetical protein
MARSILDDELRTWEVFPSTGAYGYSPRSKLVFQCTTDPAQPPRSCTLDGDTSDAEALLVRAPASELAALLQRAEPLG